MVQAVHHHRPTLKQQNKPFKSKHATKSALKDIAKGRTQRPSPKSTAVNTAAQLRFNRRNTQKQIQVAKRAALVAATRIFNGTDGAPRVVTVIPLCEGTDTKDAIRALSSAVGEELEGVGGQKVWGMKAHRFKISLIFLPVQYGRYWDALDAAKVADHVLFLFSPTVEVDRKGDTLLRTLQAQGLPTVVSVIPPDPLVHSIDQKSRSAIFESLLSFIQYFEPSQTRVYDLSNSSDSLIALRSLVEGHPREVKWRSGRPWVIGEEVEWGDGVLKVTGIVRGVRLSANRLVHVPNFGDYAVSKACPCPHRAIMSTPSPPNNSHKWMPMDVEPQVLSERVPSSADSLSSTNVPDDMANEQTWPTQEELDNAKLHDDASDREGDIEEQDHEMVPLDSATDVETDRKSVVAFHDLDAEEEEKQLKEWRNRVQEERDAQQFPDELDTPQDIPARTRFARYRGMHSFRTSPWDPYENLPRDYARIFEFDDFTLTGRDVQKAAEAEGVEPGTRVTVYVDGVPEGASITGDLPLVIYGLLEYERKKTDLHFTVQRNTEYDGSVRSKDPLTLCYGPRRLRHTRGGGKGVNNVHKFERFLWHGTTVVASVYAPVIFGRQSCTLLRETEGVQVPELVAMGSFMNPDTTRIIAKRIILAGHPFKVHRKSATVRYMFFNPDDVQYFKPIQLHTKHGRSGHVRESLGTYGYFKAHFDGPISQMDTVCMALYKRVYPRWSEAWRPESCEPLDDPTSKDEVL
ncbi:ribosome biogenesis protein tsr1 [Pisolithus croceorrhizus]|nr:ribosome biogenesis protein tsr1 [Pisolithus croceorrhizus]KAI6104666.1 ribosome biogenesis protein tsr1 [Pisolithus croceorrhizus]